MRFKSWRGLSNEYRAAVDGHSAWRPDEKNPQPVCIGDINSADISESLKSTVKREGIAALAFIPLISSGRLIGKFMVYFNRPHRFGEHELDLSLTIARQLAFAIERTRNDEQLQRSEERFRRLSESLDAEVARQTEQVRSLTHDLLRMQDEERRHIARELHDSAGQTLTVLGMSLAQLSQDVGGAAPEIGKKVEGAEGLVQQLHREIRTTSYLLHPPLLDESGLSSALGAYVQGLSERSELKVNLDIAENFGRLPSEIELAIFRFVQECLTNVHRHAGSTTAWIKISLERERIQVEVKDEGKGIAPERLAEIETGGSGVGIRGMQERMRQLGGTVKIQSNHMGTRVFASIPIPKAAQPTEIVPLQAAV
jgi:signal transduction histidine kinase